MSVKHDPDWILWAIRLWPRNHYLQAEWLRAIEVVRSTQCGWLLEPVVPQHVSPPNNVIHLERSA